MYWYVGQRNERIQFVDIFEMFLWEME